MDMDANEAAQTKKDEIEYLAMFVNPEVWLKIKSLEEGTDVSSDSPIRIKRVNPDFAKRWADAQRGVVEPKEQNVEVQATVRRRREELDALQVVDSRIVNPHPPGYEGKDPTR